MEISFKLDNEDVAINVPPHLRMSALLRDLHRHPCGALSCRNGECGKCLILLDDSLLYACMLTAFEVRSRHVKTYRYWLASDWLRYFSWAQSMHKVWLCESCKDARFLAITYLLQSSQPEERQLEEFISLVRCQCVNSAYLHSLFDLVRRLKDRYAK